MKVRQWRLGRQECATLLCTSSQSIHSGRNLPILQFAADLRHVIHHGNHYGVRAQKARRIARKNLCESIRHIIGKNVLFNAIPRVEQKISAWLQHSLGLAIARYAVGKEHCAELAADEIEGSIFERERQSVRSAPIDAAVRTLSRRGVVEHRLIEVGCGITSARRQSWRQRPGNDPTACSGLQDGPWRKGRRSPCKICGERFENQRHHVAVVVCRNRASKHFVRFRHC